MIFVRIVEYRVVPKGAPAIGKRLDGVALLGHLHCESAGLLGQIIRHDGVLVLLQDLADSGNVFVIPERTTGW